MRRRRCWKQLIPPGGLHWLQLVVQGISEEEVPWYEYVAPLMMGAEGVALSLAKHLLAIWRWNARVQGQDICPPALTVLNIGQFMMRDEVQGDVNNSLWFEAYFFAFFCCGGGSNLILGTGMENQIFILRTPAAVKFFHQILKNCHFGVRKNIIIHADGFV